MNSKKERKELIEREAQRIAKAVINDKDYCYALSCINENVPEKIMIGYEKCLLRKYNIKSLKVEGQDEVRIYILASFSESKQKKIVEEIKKLIPIIKAEVLQE